MFDHSAQSDFGPALEVHFLGVMALEQFLEFQDRLVEDLARRDDGQVRLLLCEHPDAITVGRGAAPEQGLITAPLLKRRQIDVRWVKRGGGVLVHTQGQLAVYPLVPLGWHGLSVGQYLARLQGAVLATLAALGIHGTTRPGSFDLWGRTGRLAALGVAVRHGVAYHGAFINVCPPMGLFRLLEGDPLADGKDSTLLAERGQPVKMTAVRAEVVRQMADALGCPRCHMHTGHPWLTKIPMAKRQ